MAPRDNTLARSLTSILKEADGAFQNAIDNVILEHQRLNLPLYISRDGTVVAITAEQVLKERGLMKPRL
jgi:hypothetical protein